MENLVTKTHRLIHLDLKGAPPKVQYFEKFFPFVKELGATGLLIEWEDTFPYTGELISIGGLSENAQALGAPYTTEEARQILDLAASCELMVIPLIQTFGHLEYVLKHDRWRPLREVELYPSSICPSNSETMPLLREMIKQIALFHENIQYIHIGADEVWHLARCPSCVRRAQASKHGCISILLEHICEVAQYIKENFPYLKIIAWDDMFRSIDVHILQGFYLESLIEPMVWQYFSSDLFTLGRTLWDKYSKIFSNTWIASAFKGATSSCQILPINKHHVSNHEAWLSYLESQGDKCINFQGIALTGWSRFDHYATLCELLPSAIPSLALCLKLWLTNKEPAGLYSAVGKALGYADVPLLPETTQRPSLIPPKLIFPGWEVFVGFEWYLNIKAKYGNIINSDQVNTWLNQWQVSNNRTNPMQIESILLAVTELLNEVVSFENYAKEHLPSFFYLHTIDELLGTLVFPLKQRLQQLKTDCETQINLGARVGGQKRLAL